MWTEGIRGSLVPIAAHAEWKADYDVDLFLAVGPQAAAAADLTPLPLPPGRYRGLCSYEQPDAAVPVGGPDFELTARVIPGLWTGKIAAPPVLLAVPRAPIVSLRVDGPRDVVAGEPYPLRVVLRNDTPTTQVLCGSLTLSASSKALGTFTSRVLLGATSRAPSAGESQTVELAAGAERSFVVDLGTLVFSGGRRAGAALPLAKALGQGVFALDASLGAADLAPPLTSNGLWRYVAPAEPEAR